jgi:hypothetical protein
LDFLQKIKSSAPWILEDPLNKLFVNFLIDLKSNGPKSFHENSGWKPRAFFFKKKREALVQSYLIKISKKIRLMTKTIFLSAFIKKN